MQTLTDAIAQTTTLTPDGVGRVVNQERVDYVWQPNGMLESTIDNTGGGQPEVADYLYNEVGHLFGVTLPSGDMIDYDVDGAGRRVRADFNGAVERGFVWRSQLQPFAELDDGGAVRSVFVYADSPNVPELVLRDGATYRLVKDHLGTPRLVVDVDTGVVSQRIDLDEFGRVLADSGVGVQPFGFGGRLYDSDSGIVRFGARDYDSSSGRWTLKDPIWFAGGTALLYGFADGDPINRGDVDGQFGQLLPVTIIIVGGAGGAAAAGAAFAGGFVAGAAIGIATFGPIALPGESGARFEEAFDDPQLCVPFDDRRRTDAVVWMPAPRERRVYRSFVAAWLGLPRRDVFEDLYSGAGV